MIPKNHVLIELKPLNEMGIAWNSKIGNAIRKYKYKITVKKNGPDLTWNSKHLDIPTRWIKRVIVGDISEYLL